MDQNAKRCKTDVPPITAPRNYAQHIKRTCVASAQSCGQHANWATNDWATKFRVTVNVRFRNHWRQSACRPDDWRPSNNISE